MSNADVIIEILQREGIEYLAGFPNNRLFNSAASHGMRPLIARTERVAINMADAYTRMHNGRRIGVVAVQDGPGIEASFPAVAQAYGDNTPILLLPGAHSPAMQDYDPQFIASRSFRDITKMAGLINDARTIPRRLEMAFAALKNGKPGPVLLETAAPILWGKWEGDAPAYVSPGRHRSMADPADVDAVLDALLAAQRPVLVAGHGTLYAEAWDELRTLAEFLQVPVTTTLLGKSVFPENHPLSLGTAGRTITRAAAQFLTDSDFILGIGTSFTINDFTARMPKDAVLGQVTNAPSDIAKCRPVVCAAVGDAKLVLGQLIAAARARIGDKGRAPATETMAAITALKKAFFDEWSERLLCDDAGPISPYRVIHEMNTLFDKTRSVVTHDAGNPRDQTQLASLLAVSVSDDVAGHAIEPGDRSSAAGSVCVAGLDDRQEHVGCEVGGQVRVVDAAGDEPLHRFDIVAIERLECGGVAPDAAQGMVVVHGHSSLSPAAALHQARACGRIRCLKWSGGEDLSPPLTGIRNRPCPTRLSP